MARKTTQSGFTAVELLITLFVAAAFLIAAYQLFSLVIQDGGETRAQSRASNIAYDYMRQYAASSTTIPCTATTPLNNAPINVDGLSNPTITIRITCLPNAIDSLSKVEATISYNQPLETVVYATYVSSSGNSGASDITDGLVAWWKFNGNANDSSGGGNNGTVAGAVQTTGQTSAPNTAYAFSASAAAQVLTFTSPGSLGANITASAWVRPTSYPTERSTIIESINPYAYYVSLNTDGSLQSYRFGTNPAGYHTTAAGTVPLNQWTHVAITWDSLSVNLYINGVLQRTVATTGTGVTGSQIIVGAESVSRQFIGSIDDVRIYNRTLPQTDVAKLYSAGAK